MKIVHYTSAHPWIATRIFSKMCVHLAGMGHDVSLIAVDPDASATRVFVQDGVTVHLLPGSGRKSRWQRATRMARAVTRYAASLDADILQFHDPELIPYTLTDLKRGVPLVFDAHEDFVKQMVGKTWVSGLRKRVLTVGLRGMRKLINWRATHVIAATEGVREDYDPRKSTVIRNLPILSEITRADRKPLTERLREACYIGSISRVRGIAELVKALEHSTQIERFHLAGIFASEAFQREVEALPGWSKVSYHGFINRQQIVNLLGRVRVGVVTLHATPNHLHSIPIKLLEYLCAGVPSLASNFPYWSEFVSEGETGFFVDPMDPQAIAATLDRMLSDECAAKSESFMTEETRNRFSWQEEVQILENIYYRCMNS
jgi:glycosyltransferase involved in cell wall biosynthesis